MPQEPDVTNQFSCTIPNPGLATGAFGKRETRIKAKCSIKDGKFYALSPLTQKNKKIELFSVPNESISHVTSREIAESERFRESKFEGIKSAMYGIAVGVAIAIGLIIKLSNVENSSSINKPMLIVVLVLAVPICGGCGYLFGRFKGSSKALNKVEFQLFPPDGKVIFSCRVPKDMEGSAAKTFRSGGLNLKSPLTDTGREDQV